MHGSRTFGWLTWAPSLTHPNDDEGDDAELVESARLDPSAFGDLYRRYLTRVYRYVRTRASSDEEAADLTQQVFLQAFDALPHYRERGNPFAAWLFRIARNVTTDAHRRRRETVAWDLLPEALHPTVEGGAEAEVLRRESLLRLRGLLAELDPEKREVVALHFVARLTLREIGVTIGKSEDAVQKQLSRTIHRLKEQYREE